MHERDELEHGKSTGSLRRAFSVEGGARRSALPAPHHRTPAPAALLALQRAVGNAAVAAMMADQETQPVQRSAVHEVLRSAGRPMDAAFRGEMEARFGGADFSGVRVHSDTAAQRSALEIQAVAYASGSHVVDGGGMTKEDWAHELTHYLDQQAGPVPGTDNGSGLRLSDPTDAGERRAVDNARKVVSGPVPAPRATADGTGTHRDGRPTDVQRTKDDDLGKAKNPEEIIAALEKSGHSNDDAWQLMRYMTSQQFPAAEGQEAFNILDSIKDPSSEQITRISKRMAEPLMAKRWTIRHYAGKDPKNRPTFREIASTYDNALAGRVGGHTNVADWRTLGNIKFTFYLVAVDGKVPQRNWLNDTHWYAEWDLDKIEECWVSADLLAKMNKPKDADAAREAMKSVKAFRGSGKELKKLLAARAYNSGNDPAQALDSVIGGAFELKVPGGLKLNDEDDWKEK